MKKLFTLLLLGISFHANSQFLVNTTPNAATMVTNLLGAGVTATNPTLNGSPQDASGTFTCTGGCNLGFTSGIILTSGSAIVATQANTGTGQGAAFSTTQIDPQLATLATGPIFDACVLEFDFWVASDRVRFNYIFGSDEYSDFTNTGFNDVFGFFLSGPGITPSPKNIAIVPGTANTPVAINNVNNGGPVGHGIPPPGPCMNCAYFRDNSAPVTYTTAWDGITTSLMAQSKVCPCETYHIKLAVSDVNDQVYDSGVLLEQNSFSSVGQAAIYINGVQQPNNQIIYLCPGQSVNLCVVDNITCTSNLNFSWNGGLSGTTQCITVNQANLATNGNYTCVITHNVNTGCFVWTSSVKVVYLTPPPAPSITPSGSTVICPGGSVNLTASPAGYNYQWSSGETTQTITASAVGTYTVTVSNQCGTTSTSITVTAGSAPASISGVTAICNGANTTLTANAGQSYQWSTGDATQSINVGSSGTYTVTVTQVGGCTASASVNVTVNTSPSPSINGNLNVCPGISTVLDAGAGYASYQWSSGGSISQFLNVSSAGTYTVTVSNAAGCTGTASVTVNLNPVPNPSITGNTTFCQGNNSTLNAGAGFSSYLWTGGSTLQTLNVTTSGTYVVTVTNSSGCTASTSVNITVNNNPSPTISGTLGFCSGSNTTLTAPAGFSNYQWSNGSGSSSITVNNAATYTVTVTDANGCIGSASVFTVVNPLPTPSITGTNTICQNQTTTFNAGAGYSIYQWSTGGSGQTISTGTAGNYVVTVTDANGCTGSTSINLTVNPLPSPSITGNTTFCQGNNSTLNAGAGFSSYLWTGGSTSQTLNVTSSGSYVVTVTNSAGCTASASVNVTVNNNPSPAIAGTLGFCSGSNTTLTAPAGFSNYQWSNGSGSSSITVNNAATYTVTVTDANGCIGSASVTTIVNPLPTPAITGVNTICQNQTTIFDAGIGYSTYQWSTGGSGQTISTGAAGNYVVTVTDANGCTGSTSINLTVNPLPSPSISGNTTFCQGSNSTLNAGAGFSSYLWTGGSTSQTLNVIASGTYVVTVTNSSGCTASTSVNITVNNNPSPTISGTLGFCSGSNTTLTAPAGFSNYQWSNGSGSSSITVNNAATYTVTVTDANGCIGSASVSTVVNPLPSPSITGVNTICQNQTTIFDAGNGYSTYQWSTGGSGQTISTGTAGNYVVTVTDANGCTGSTSINLTVNPLPSPSITGNTTFCQGNNSTLNAGAGFSSYLWTGGSTSQTLNVTSSGSYVVTVTDGNGCSNTASTTITVNPLPTPQISGTNTICDGNTTTLNAGNYSNYQWSTGSNNSSITTGTAGSYIVTVTDANGCVGTSPAFNVIVNPLPTAAVSMNSTICIGQSSSISINFTGTGPFNYVYSNGTQNFNGTSATTSTSITFSPGTTTTYTLISVSDANCSGNVSGSATITVNPLPTPSVTGNTVFCQGDATVLNAGNGYQNYVWSDGSTGQTLNTGTAGIYIVTVTDGNGCTNTASAIVIVNPLPTPQITGINTICDGNTTTLNAGNFVSYQWSTGNNSSAITTGTAGNYVVTVTDANGCVGTSPAFNVIVNPLPAAVMSQNSTICAGQSATINLTFTGTGPYSFTYTNGLQNFSGNASGNSTTITLSPGVSTTYSLLTVSDANCSGNVSGNATITVNPLPAPSISGVNMICDGASTTFTTGNYNSYQWSNGANTQQITILSAGNYVVTVTDQNGCTATASRELIVNPTPVAAFTNDSSLTCDKPFINFFNYSAYPAGSVFVWDFGDGSQSGQVSPSHVYNEPGTYPVSLTITTSNGCTGSIQQNVIVEFLPFPVADFYTDKKEVSITNSTIRMIDQSQHAVSWLWDFGDGNGSTDRSPAHSFSDYGKYRIKQIVTNIAGCRDEKEQEVYVTPFFVPNAFTPNDDGLNDYFFNVGYEMNLQSFRMAIWNRWGQKVFESDNPNSQWDGKSGDGKPVAEGVYVYQIKFMNQSGKDYNFEGRVTVLR